jgi:uncharacterized coiled-coil DUF342 family protein
MVSPLKGKTYEEIYGFEKAQELKRLRAEQFSRVNKGRKHTEEWKRRISLILKGRKRPEHAKLMKERYLKGLWYPPAKNPEIAKKISEIRKKLFKEGKLISPMKGKRQSEEHRLKNSLSHKGKPSPKKIVLPICYIKNML